MKKAIKIILPLFLVLVLLVVGYWFFFQARTDLTAQGLIRLGDWLETGQHYRLAINSFSMANKLQPQDADLALKLAQAYRNSSNFTQTERTLVNAIYASPDDTRLYVALSKVYVEQDKLMDAQQMLDNIANPTVLAELSSRRPLAPKISPEGGYYSEYITVSLTRPATSQPTGNIRRRRATFTARRWSSPAVRPRSAPWLWTTRGWSARRSMWAIRSRAWLRT